jgi:arylsulfatase A-like enzyme
LPHALRPHPLALPRQHLGLATPDHTPRGRGYAHSLSYLSGANDYWQQTSGDWCGAGSFTDLWGSTSPALGLNSSWACSNAHQPASCHYEEDIFLNFTLAQIAAHNASAPLMLYYAPHSVHMPLEVPAAQLAKFSNITDSVPRQYYTAMTNYVDAHIGQVVSALQAKGMWNNTLLALLGDNGGPVYGGGSGCTKCNGNAGANNWPLRCG